MNHLIRAYCQPMLHWCLLLEPPVRVRLASSQVPTRKEPNRIEHVYWINSQQNYSKYRYDVRGAGSFCIKPARELQFGHRKRGRPSGCRYGNRYTRSDRREKASPLRLRARRPDLPARAGGPSPQRGVGIAGRSWRFHPALTGPRVPVSSHTVASCA
jgi:hypothetical protein